MVRRRISQMTRFGQWLALLILVGSVGSATVVYLRWRWREQRYNHLIEETAGRYGIDKFLVKAVIRRESEFDPFVYGRAGEIGLMQVTEGAGREWARATGRKDFGRDSLWDERANIDAGTWYLTRALNRWRDKDDPIPFALAEYNAGFGNVLRWLPRGQATTDAEFREAITFPGVRRYVDSVIDFYDGYRANGQL